jgi:hypothetical protein
VTLGDDVVKDLVELSATEEEADNVIEKYTSRKTYAKKVEFLTEQFPHISIVARCDGPSADSIQTDYYALLTAVVNSSWR